MKIKINSNGIWYHGSDKIFDMLEAGSTVTQCQELAEVFSHKPKFLFYTKKGNIFHTGRRKGYLYIIDEPIIIKMDVYQHPKTTIDKNAEFLTTRALKVKMIKEC